MGVFQQQALIHLAVALKVRTELINLSIGI